MSVVYAPARAYPFVNREDVYRAMRELVDRRRAEGRPCLLLVHGPEGIGASALAVELFDRDPDCFGGLRIWISARQADGTLVPLGEILRLLLRGLTVPDVDQETTLADRVAEYQRVSKGRRFLAVIDDVGSAEQVVSAIPVDAPQAVILVTARVRMLGLINSDFSDFALDRLPSAESRVLFRERLGSTVERVDESTLDELADLCCGFPLLIRVLAAQLVGRPHRAARLLTELRTTTAALLTLDDQQRMTRFLDLAHGGLTRQQALAFRLLSLIPGQDFGVEVAAAVLEVDADQTAGLLDELVEANLVTFAEPGRYGFHEIIRADARIRAHQLDGQQACAAAIGRAVHWYLRQAARHDDALSNRWRVGTLFQQPGDLAESTGQVVERGRAVDWFAMEWSNVVACVKAAHHQQLHQVARQCCVALFKFLHTHGYVEPCIDVHNVALESAQDDREAIMQLTSQRGAAYLAAGDHDNARRDFVKSLTTARELGHKLGEQSALEWLGKVAVERDVAAALDLYDQSWRVTVDAGDAIAADQRARVFALLHLQRARAWLKLADWERAKVAATAALEYFERQPKEAENEAKSLLVLGQALLGAGAATEAAERLERALALFTADGARRAEAQALESIGDAAVAAGDHARGAEAYQGALLLLDKRGAERAAQVRAKLAELGHP